MLGEGWWCSFGCIVMELRGVVLFCCLFTLASLGYFVLCISQGLDLGHVQGVVIVLWYG